VTTGTEAPAVGHTRVRRGGALGAGALAALIGLCALVLVLGYANKQRCTGPKFDGSGRSTPDLSRREMRDVCYSDIQQLWVGRDIDKHVFPYVHGGITDDGQLTGGTVEYPVLTGVLVWAGAIFANNDAQFLAWSALILAPFGLFTAWALGRLSRWRALIWALGPPLVLYAFHNWDLAVVAAATAGFLVLFRGWGKRGADRPLVQRAMVASVLFGLGFALKIYPAIFVLPLMCWVATDGRRPGSRYDWASAAKVALVAAGTAVLVNLPFAVLGWHGWLASFTFQELRPADITSNSIWFWGLRPWSDSDNSAFQSLVGVLSPIGILLSFALALWLGGRRYRRDGVFPFVAVSAAMLCGFLLLHKVHSPQYTLWLLPMFVLLRVRWQWIAAYLFADLAMGIGIFRWYYGYQYASAGGIFDGLAAQAVVIGVWGRAALLIGLFFAFLNARSSVSSSELPSPDNRLDRPVGRHAV
jgi:uncharacterized membrane protein